MNVNRAALEVLTRDRLPEDWGMAQNNLGFALSDLASRSVGERSEGYLEASVEAFRASLSVFTEAHSPLRWYRTMRSLAGVYERQSRLAEARTCYEQLLRHTPGDPIVQLKLRELSPH